MNWLLKIVEGPMKGAEIALVNGMRVKFGSSPDCDIVVADSTVGAVAFELDVAESGVTLVGVGGEARPLRAFEIADAGTTSVAVGPAEGDWQPLTRPAPVEAAPEAAPVEATSEAAPTEEPVAPAEDHEEDSAGKEPERRRKGGCGCLAVLLLLLLVAAAVVWILWRYCPPARPVLEKASPAITWVRSEAVAGWNWCKAKLEKEPPVVETPEEIAARRKLALDEIASEYGLVLDESGDAPRLVGNLRRRTERLAIRALALAADDRVEFDLADDETLLSQANELLFACSDGALRAIAATNRHVTVTGYAPTPEALERAVRALAADVPLVDTLDTSSIVVGGLPPSAVAGTAFVRDAAPAKPTTGENLRVRRNYPIAGILTEPYPCVVLADGLRLIEGAQIGGAVLEKIEADRLTLKEGEHRFEWKP